MWDNLPAEISNDILHRLGVETLIKCTSLSKSFLSLITSPAFISTHIAKHTNSHLLLRYFTEDKKENYHFELDDDDFSGFQTQGLHVPFRNYINRCFTVAGCVNGVLCLVNDVRIDFPTDGTLIILWNPSIRKFVHVPQPIIESCQTRGVYNSVCGFGYDSISDDYKVVRIISRDEVYEWEPPPTTIQPSQVEVYSLKSGCWRLIGDAPNYYMRQHHPGCIPCFINGSIYWKCFSIMGPRKCVILKFDMYTESFEIIQLTGNLMENDLTSISIILHIQECKGNLSLIKGNHDRLKTFSVWLMKEDGVVKSWTKMFDIDIDKLCPPRNPRAFGFRNNGEVIMVKGGHNIYLRDNDKSVVIVID